MIRGLRLAAIATLVLLAPTPAAARNLTRSAPKTAPTTAASPAANPATGAVHLLVPAYFGPAEGWATMCSEMPTGSTAIVNPESGPGFAKQSSYSTAITRCNSDGQKVIGYIYTEEGNRSISTAEAQIADYYSWYPVGGIFLDGMAEAPDTSYYATLESFIHAKGGIVVGNPGDTASTDWQLGVVDQLVIFEGSASEFAHYEPAAWVTAAASSRIAIIVYSATVGVCSTAEADNAGSVFVTNLSEPNPYGALPSYWTTETEKCATPLPSASQGTWTGAVGSAGYDLAAWDGESDVSYLPNASLNLTQGSRYEWASSTEDPRALQSPDGLIRDAATYYDSNQIRLSLTFNSAYAGNLHLYALDWDSQGRRETISAGGQTATLSSNFTQGAWVSFPISAAAGETIPITVDRTAGPNAVLSGIFLGDAGPPPAPSIESAPQGAWVNAVGSAGYDLAGFNGASGDLSYLPDATLTLTQGSRWQWAENTTDPRALSDPGGEIRNAGTYYDPNEIQMKLSFNEAYSGNLHLYAVDWDSGGRREIISVNGQSAVLSSDFSQGAWVSFPIKVAAGATVSITVTRLAGANAVLSGIFLGDAGPPPAPTVTSARQGKWVGAVGSGGYALTGWNGTNGDLSYLPDATLTLTQGSRYEWATNTTDTRALTDPGEQTRNAGTYYDPNQIQMLLSFTEAYSGTLHLYALDWDSQGRREVITVNGQSAELSSGFSQGAWVSFTIKVAAGASIPITITRLAGPNAVLSGIFLGEGGPPPGATVSSSPQGDWVGAYGSAGYALAAWNETTDLTELPKATLTVEQASRWVWTESTEDVRALESPNQSTREAATYYEPNEIKLKLTFNEAYSGTLRLYALDWDSQGRREIISVNGQSAVLSSDFSQGAWVSFPISVQASGSVSIVVDRTAGPNAVLSGIFLG